MLTDVTYKFIQSLSELAVALGLTLSFVYWVYRRIRNADIYRSFVYDMATNHLPHIYHEQRRSTQRDRQLTAMIKAVASGAGVMFEVDESVFDEEDPPPIQFVQLNGNGRKR